MKTRQNEMKKNNNIVFKKWYRVKKVTALQAYVWRQYDESILIVLWFEIEWLIFDLNVKQ